MALIIAQIDLDLRGHLKISIRAIWMVLKPHEEKIHLGNSLTALEWESLTTVRWDNLTAARDMVQAIVMVLLTMEDRIALPKDQFMANHTIYDQILVLITTGKIQDITKMIETVDLVSLTRTIIMATIIMVPMSIDIFEALVNEETLN